MSGVVAAVSAAVAIRFALYATKLCGVGVHPVVWIAAAIAAAAAAFVATRAPTRRRVSLELLSKLGVAPSDAFAARLPPIAAGRLVVAAVACATALPLALGFMRRQGVGLEAQAIFFVAFAIAAPALVRRALDRDAPSVTKIDLQRTALAIGAGFVLTAALMNGAHAFFDAGAELARCTGKLDTETRRALAQEADEIARGLANVRASPTAIAIAVAVGPLVEERIYRDLLMNALVRKYGLAYGLFASAIIFGLAHVGIYQMALYQTVLLGVAFGIAYAEGGLLAAFTVHAAWNLLRLASSQ